MDDQCLECGGVAYVCEEGPGGQHFCGEGCQLIHHLQAVEGAPLGARNALIYFWRLNRRVWPQQADFVWQHLGQFTLHFGLTWEDAKGPLELLMKLFAYLSQGEQWLLRPAFGKRDWEHYVVGRLTVPLNGVRILMAPGDLPGDCDRGAYLFSMWSSAAEPRRVTHILRCSAERGALELHQQSLRKLLSGPHGEIRVVGALCPTGPPVALIGRDPRLWIYVAGDGRVALQPNDWGIKHFPESLMV